MQLLSLEFALCILFIFLLYWTIDNNYRWIVLLLFNYVFYFLNSQKYFVLLLIITFFTYLITKLMNNNNKRTLLVIGIVINVLMLFSFKYLNFSIQLINTCFDLNYELKNIILPLGISFYTFEAISYLVDVYRGQVPENNLGIFATYLSYFPTISSGPIEKSKHIIDQVKNEKDFLCSDGTYNLKIIAWGLFEKIVIADNIASYINPVYENIYDYSGLTLIAIVILYAIQIYADFAGYSNIAKGISGLFGIELVDNFKEPYFSTTIKEFWSKWHISLSTWLKDYFYIPLGGNRCSKIKHYFNLVITFLISGLWHGSNITFVIWGLIHGVLQVLENALHIKQVKERYSLIWWIRCLLLFIVLCISWTFFRASSISEALYILNPINYLTGINNPLNYISNAIGNLSLDRYSIICLLLNLLILFFYDFYNQKTNVIKTIGNKNNIVKYVVYTIIIILILCLKSTSGVSFVYEQF